MSSSSPARLKPFGQLEPLSAAAPWAIFPRKKLDVTYRDIGAGMAACLQLREHQRPGYEQKISNLWDPSGHAMITLSVRTGFDLLLQTLKFAPGTEVLCSAITIPDMLYVLRYHGLVPVPVDLDPETLAVDVEVLKKAVTQKTKMMLIAHIFGSRFPLDEALEYTGESRADVSMFSFGTIKTATSFGGAIIHVKNSAVLDEMHRREKRYPCRTNLFFFKRLVKYGVLHGISTPAVYGLFLHACRAVGADHDKVITSAIRGFSGGELVSLIQYRPSMALLGLMHRRLTCMDEQYVALRKSKSEQLANAIKDLPNVSIPGHHAEKHYYWLFPVCVPSPEDVVNYMNKHGFDVTSGATQLAYVPSPLGHEHDPVHAKSIMTSLVYLPVTPETPDWAIEKMMCCFRDALQSSSRL
ncbi:UDP-4-amino-4-deoxy-L-arabinose--oxoglutarate aminotransferase [Phytophthora ramorum]|uniref:UDP-4-amino-4-deoxy-L-arabinose--oxoglutarate aminotransferase n=1 Tax=Phytophthora ramorum TaxID=164328 RepID=UPI0030A3E970|nr:UDP-4-amino-4-deoxy-L-arabinose--oxoglutarate aminotransferase [Phytophthora ramorum]